MSQPHITPDDVVRAADFVVEALTPSIGSDWSVRAGQLEWDVERTITHMTAGPAKYTLYLASRSSRFMAVRIDRWPEASQAERLDAIGQVARALANVVASSPPATRAFHARGMADPEGFAALACHELLIHGHDVARGLGISFRPEEKLCRAVTARLTPWLVQYQPAWDTMLWHQNRIDLPGRPASDDESLIVAPLTEWDGVIPRGDPRPVIEWIKDDDGARWRPRHLDENS